MNGHKYEFGRLVDYSRERASGVYQIDQLTIRKAKRFNIASRTSTNLRNA